MEVDVLRLLRALLKRWKLIVASVAVFLVASAIVTQFLLTPMYRSSSTVLISLKTKVTSSSDINLERSMVDTYIVYLGSDRVLSDVCEAVNGHPEVSRQYTVSQLRTMHSASSINGTEVIQISATCGDPKDAQIITDALVAWLEPTVVEMHDVERYRVLDYATLPTSQVSPKLRTNLIVAVLLALVVSCGGIVLVEIFDKRIKNENMLTEITNAPVIGIIPNIE